MPRSSQSELAASTASGSDTPQSGPSANTFSYSTRARAAAGRRVDVLAADRAGGAAVAGHEAELVQLLGGEPRRALERGRAEVARGQRVDRVEGEEVRERAELAVLGGGGAEGAAAQVLGGGEHGGGVGERRLHAGAAHRDRLDVLRAQDRAEAAAAGVTAVVRDGRVADEPLAGGADRGDAPRRSEPLAEPRLGLGGGKAPEVGGAARCERRRRPRAAPRARRTRRARRSRRCP